MLMLSAKFIEKHMMYHGHKPSARVAMQELNKAESREESTYPKRVDMRRLMNFGDFTAICMHRPLHKIPARGHDMMLASI